MHADVSICIFSPGLLSENLTMVAECKYVYAAACCVLCCVLLPNTPSHKYPHSKPLCVHIYTCWTHADMYGTQDVLAGTMPLPVYFAVWSKSSGTCVYVYIVLPCHSNTSPFLYLNGIARSGNLLLWWMGNDQSTELILVKIHWSISSRHSLPAPHSTQQQSRVHQHSCSHTPPG